MNIELLIGNTAGTKVYMPAVQEGIEWSTERRSTPGKLTFKVMKDDILDFSEGSPVRLKVDGDKVFFGFVFKQARTRKGTKQMVQYSTVHNEGTVAETDRVVWSYRFYPDQ